jgi:transcriptional regulator with XRE-family HTH domain
LKDFKKRREEMGLTMEQVAERANMSVQAYRLIEKGLTRNPRKETVEAIEAALDGCV